MPEPSVPQVRPTGMKPALLVVALLVLAACGSAEESGGSAARSKPSSSSTVVVCMAGKERLLTKADVDGDGTKELIRVSRGSGSDSSCPPSLVVAPSVGTPSQEPMVELSPDEPLASSGFAVALQDRRSELVVTKAVHPRGGYQLRVYAAGDNELVELKSDGQSLLPFVATDVQEHPWSIDCTDDGLVYTEAVAHEPVGVAAAWDIRQTTYTLDGTTLTKGPTKEVAGNVLPKDLDAKYADLVEHSAFESCRA